VPQFTAKKKLILTMLIINCEMNHLTENEAMKYINQFFGKNVSRRTYYNYRKSIFQHYEKSMLEEYDNRQPERVIHHDLTKASKGIVSMALLKEKIFLIRKGFKLGFNLIKYDRSVIQYAQHITDPDPQIKLLMDRSKRLIEKARSRK
jgi:hypothetical protein